MRSATAGMPSRIGVWSLAAGLAVLGVPAGAAESLRLPFDVDAVRKARDTALDAGKPASFRCAAHVPPPRALTHAPKFRTGDASASELDTERLAREESATADLRAFNRIVATSADRALAHGASRDAAAHCVIRHLEYWAQADALAGPNSMQGDFERKWSAITWSLAYAENRGAASPVQSTAIEKWLRAAGKAVMEDYSHSVSLSPLPKTENNHSYWAALSVAAIGVALDDRRFFQWAIARLPAALAAIGPDGSLPLEMKRGSRALEYHRFAAEPLLMLTLLARANGVPVSDSGMDALKRLVGLVRRGTEDPQLFRNLTGRQQQALDASLRNVWVWAELAMVLFPDPSLDAQIAPYRPLARTWLGGDLSLRYSPAR